MSYAPHPKYEICHLFLSPLQGESRLFKELGTAELLFPAERLGTIGLDRGEGPLSGKLQGKYPFERIRLRSVKLPKSLPFQLVKYIEWTVRAASRAQKSGAEILHCHSLGPLLATVIAAKFGDANILYDAHELESERAGFSRLRSRILATYERFLLSFVEEILVVSPSIREAYDKRFPDKNITLLMNIPKSQKGAAHDLRREFGVNDTDFLVMYVGGLVPGRGIELLLDAFSGIGEKFHLVFMGNGPMESAIKEHEYRGNIHLKRAVAEQDVVPTIECADLSFSVNNCDSLNHQYSLPNKFFQSLMAGVPVMVNTQNVDMLAVGSDTGMVYGVAYDVGAIREFIRSFKNRESPRAAQNFSWEGQESILISAYNRLLQRSKKHEAGRAKR